MRRVILLGGPAAGRWLDVDAHFIETADPFKRVRYVVRRAPDWARTMLGAEWVAEIE